MALQLRSLLSSLSPKRAGRFAANVTPDWMQGRTTYGGLSSALCLEGARRVLREDSDAADWPLRSAQVSFLGPMGGAIEIDASVVRRGKAMSFVRSDALSDDGDVSTTATFAFGATRESAFNEVYMRPPANALRPPDDCPSLTTGFPEHLAPAFTRHFDCRLARGAFPGSAASESDNWLYVRFDGCNADGGVDGVDTDVALLALADMPPPAIMSRFSGPAPISSINWHVNIVQPNAVAAEGGWWLLHQRAEAAADGYVSQDMTVYGGEDNGTLVAAGRQSVAIYA